MTGRHLFCCHDDRQETTGERDVGPWRGLPRTPARCARPRCGRDATPPDTCAPQPPSSKPFASAFRASPGPRASVFAGQRRLRKAGRGRAQNPASRRRAALGSRTRKRRGRAVLLHTLRRCFLKAAHRRGRFSSSGRDGLVPASCTHASHGGHTDSPRDRAAHTSGSGRFAPRPPRTRQRLSTWDHLPTLAPTRIYRTGNENQEKL